MTHVRNYHNYFVEVAYAYKETFSFNPRLWSLSFGYLDYNEDGTLDVSLSSAPLEPMHPLTLFRSPSFLKTASQFHMLSSKPSPLASGLSSSPAPVSLNSVVAPKRPSECSQST